MSDSENDSTIVMTGVTAGFGLRALGIVAQNTSNPIIVGARDASKLPSQIRDKVTVLPLDLSQLDTVVDFCSQVSEHGPVGSLILNAGTSSRKMAQTTDGLDLTFQANYWRLYT